MIINAANERLLKIGIKGENIATGVDFSAFVDAFRAEYGSVSAAVAIQRAGDEAPYLKPLTDEGVWVIGAEDITPGGGFADLICTGGETVKKWRFKTIADDSLGDTADPPEVWRSYVDQITGLVDSIENMTISAVQSDTPYVIKSKDAEGRVHLTFGLVMGKNGDDGVSPTLKVERTADGVRVIATDKGGTTSADITDGKDAVVTAEAIESALGYTPADAADLRSTITPVYNTGKGRYLYGGEPTSTLQPGNVYTASRYATCDFLPVVPGMRLHLEGFRADAQRAVCAYNRAQELVKVLAVGQTVGYIIDEVLPDDAYFIRACTDYDSATGEVTGTISGYLYGNVTNLVVRHDSEIAAKQDKLVSGQTIKSINGESLLGEGNIVVQGGGGIPDYELITSKTIAEDMSTVTINLPEGEYTHLMYLLHNNDNPTLSTTSAGGANANAFCDVGNVGFYLQSLPGTDLKCIWGEIDRIPNTGLWTHKGHAKNAGYGGTQEVNHTSRCAGTTVKYFRFSMSGTNTYLAGTTFYIFKTR